MGVSLSQPNSLTYLPSAKNPSRQDSAHSDTQVLSMSVTGSNTHQNKSGSDVCLVPSVREESKSAGYAPGMGGNYGDLGWLNVDNSSSMLGGSMNMLPYCDQQGGSLCLAPPDQFQLSLLEDPSLKNSTGNLNGLTSSGDMQSFVESSSTGHHLLFGSDDPQMLDHHTFR